MSQADSFDTINPSCRARPVATLPTAPVAKPIFEIYNMNAGEVLGVYAAASEAEALDAMARDYGFADYNAVIADYGVSREEAIGELQITVVS